MSTVSRTYTYRLNPTAAQASALRRMLETCRWWYNQVLGERKRLWDAYQVSVSQYDTEKWITRSKPQHPRLKQVHSHLLQNVCQRVQWAFEGFFRRLKTNEKAGYPRFKGFGRYDSFTFKEYGNGVTLRGTRLSVSKIGDIAVVLHRPVEGIIKTVTIRHHRTGKWFVCLSVERGAVRRESNGKAVGVDVGLERFATYSDGTYTPRQRFFQRDERDLVRLQRRWDAVKHLPNTSRVKRKRRKAVARCHERIRTRRHTFIHQTSRALVNAYDLMVIEDLSILPMMKHPTLAKSIQDAAWGLFANAVTYKAEEAGGMALAVDPRGTSQECWRCGTIVRKTLSARWHECRHCGESCHRDENASRVILGRGLAALGYDP